MVDDYGKMGLMSKKNFFLILLKKLFFLIILFFKVQIKKNNFF